MLNKILVSDSGLLDKTATLDDYNAGTLAVTLTTGTDAIYLGSKLPFTRKYLKLSAVNATASVLTVSYWDGTTWQSAVNVQDGTSPSATSLAQTGYVSWETDKRYAWTRDDTTVSGTEKITGLGDVTLYDMYWVKLSWSANVSATVDWIGDLFCSDTELGAEFPDLNRTAAKEAWATGKTTWEEQRVAASKLVSQGIQAFQVAPEATLVMNTDALMLACVQRTAAIIYAGFGEGYEDSWKAATDEYARRMDRKLFVTDENENGRVDPAETNTVRVTRMSR